MATAPDLRIRPEMRADDPPRLRCRRAGCGRRVHRLFGEEKICWACHRKAKKEPAGD